MMNGVLMWMLSTMKEKWTDQIKDLGFTEFNPLIENKPKVFTSYEYAQSLGEGNWVALKSGMGDYQHFVKVNENGEEEVLHVPGVLMSCIMARVGIHSIEDRATSQPTPLAQGGYSYLSYFSGSYITNPNTMILCRK